MRVDGFTIYMAALVIVTAALAVYVFTHGDFHPGSVVVVPIFRLR